jgi:hypothetical protein
MAGVRQAVNRASKRALAGALGLAAAWSLVPVAAGAKTLTVHTNRGGTCHLHTTASRSGTTVAYGVKVNDCSTRFGVRYAESRGILYDESDGLPVANGYMDQKRGRLPYANHRNVTGTQVGHSYRTRIDISVVLKTRRDSSTRHPERWRDPGGRCRVKTTWHDGDTLGCVLRDSV